MKLFCELATLLDKSDQRWRGVGGRRDVVGFARDGAPAMTDKNNGAAATLKIKELE
jgi:hypothetical protein